MLVSAAAVGFINTSLAADAQTVSADDPQRNGWKLAANLAPILSRFPAPSFTPTPVAPKLDFDLIGILHDNALAIADSARTGDEQGAEGRKKSERIIEISVPLEIDGFYLGDISARATVNGEVLEVDTARFVALVRPRLNAAAQAQLDIQAANAGSVITLAALAQPGLQVVFDQQDLKLIVRVAPDVASASEIALAPSNIDQPNANTLLPAGFSFGLNFFGSKAYNHRSSANPASEGFLPLNLGVDGFVNVGGIDGVSLLHQWTYRDGSDSQLTRGPMTLLHDDWRNAVRYAAGDVDPFPLPQQGATPLGGFQISRAFNDLQPTRNVRPAGRTNFILERDAIVEVEVNGVVTRTLQLRAGNYNLRDLPFTEGLNEVRLLIQDGAGRREIASFSRSFTTSLLEKGLDEFSFAFGVPRIGTPGGFTYRDQPQVTGFYRTGLTQNFTAGVNFQADGDTQVVGAEALLATRLGTFRLEMAGSRTDGGRAGYAATAAYFKSFALGRNLGEIEAIWDHRSRNYTVLNQGRFGTDLEDDVSVRYRQSLPSGFFTNIVLGYTGRRTGIDETRWSGGLSKTFGKFFLSALYEGRKREGLGTEHAAFLNLSVRLGPRENLVARYASRENRYRVEYERSVTNQLGDWGVRAGVGGADGERSLQGQVDYFANRAELGARFDLFDDTFNGNRTRQSTLRFATAVGFADGAFAIGRPFRDGFVVVKGHPSLEGRPVDVSAGVTDEIYGRTDMLGPVLISTFRNYQRNPIRVNVDDLPPGYDLGSATYELFPGTRSGFSITVGSDASRTLLGTLVDEEGQPIALLPGRVRSLDRPDATVIPLFTNRAGRFVASALQPGRYVIEIDNRKIEVTIDEDKQGLVNVGRVVITKGSAP